MPGLRRRAALAAASLALATAVAPGALRAQGARAAVPDESIPLPEHPRPDFQRADWVNLNGRWRFAFDKGNAGEGARWFAAPLAGTRQILVPFSWGAPLSGVLREPNA